VSAFISAIQTGAAREVAAFGTRGDGKTQGAFGAMIAHAQAHQAAGCPLPTKWLGAADTFISHRNKTLDSLRDPMWAGCWELKDDGHQALFRVAGQTLVDLRLFGVEDQSGMDRLRAECHGLWFEEPAPSSVLVQSSGLSESAWALGMTSQRLPSHAHPAVMTLNYPDEDHWTWQRFVERQHPGTAYFRIPPGERASATQRAEWERALANRPDLLRRLLAGQPGTVMLGEQVAVGFNEDAHAPKGLVLKPEPGVTLWIGQDGGLTPTSVIGQRLGPRVRVVGALTTEHGGIRQHVEYLLRPWLEEHAPWALRQPEAVVVMYDPSMNTDDPGDSESKPLRVMQSLIAGIYRPGPVNWSKKAPNRKDPMLAIFNDMVQGTPALQIDPVKAKGLVRALRGGWHYPTDMQGKRSSDEPVKSHPDSDFGDAFAYMVCGMRPTSAERQGPRQTHATTGASDPFGDRRRELASRATSATARRW
jgi:hypothetical protein